MSFLVSRLTTNSVGLAHAHSSVTSLAAQACSGLKWFCDLVNYSLAQMLSASAENEDW